MNVELLKKVKEAILANSDRFDMSTFIGSSQRSECGTAMCIAGWAVFLSGDTPVESTKRSGLWTWKSLVDAEACGGYVDPTDSTATRAAKLLDLDEETAIHLFLSPRAMDCEGPKGAQRAAMVIDHLIATGKVVW